MAPDSIENLPYRKCVGIMLLNRDNRVWVGRRKKGKGVVETTAWQMPQGGIDGDEAPLAAARRELYEETNVRSITELDRSQTWFRYDLPPSLVGLLWGGRYRGQQQQWFAFRFEGEDSEIDIHRPGDGVFKAEFDAWRWQDMDTLVDNIVPFKRDVYRRVVATFSHLRHM